MSHESPELQNIMKGGKAADFLQRSIGNPELLSEVWDKVVQTLKKSNAGRLYYEAEILALALKEGAKGRQLSQSDRNDLRQLAALYPDVAALRNSPAIHRTKHEGDKTVYEKVADYLDAIEPDGASARGFGWGACAFCAALAFPEFGPAGSAIACAVCGAL